MEKYCIVESGLKENHAGAKARRDAADILTEEGWTPVFVHHSEEKGTADKILMALRTAADWRRVLRTVPERGQLLVQYPLAMYPKVSRIAIPFLRRLREKKVTLIYLVHDLDSLRGLGEEGDRLFLGEADCVIVHNDAMLKKIEELGFSGRPAVRLGLFDYRIPGRTPAAGNVREKNTVVIAGNLKPEKAGYLRELGQLDGEVTFRLYGPNFVSEGSAANVRYEGETSPEELPFCLHGGFGLVWDGDSIDRCSGVFGEYLKYNNPHKASLYLAAGLPVIIWSGAALAPFIESEGVGFSVASLRELPEMLAGIDEERYEAMAAGARRLAAELGSGRRLRRALGEAERMMEHS